VNQSQTIGSITMRIGWRMEWSPNNSVPNVNERSVHHDPSRDILAGIMSEMSPLYHKSDEASYVASATPCGSGKACIIGELFKTRMQQGNFATLRDLDWARGNESNLHNMVIEKAAHLRLLYV